MHVSAHGSPGGRPVSVSHAFVCSLRPHLARTAIGFGGLYQASDRECGASETNSAARFAAMPKPIRRWCPAALETKCHAEAAGVAPRLRCDMAASECEGDEWQRGASRPRHANPSWHRGRRGRDNLETILMSTVAFDQAFNMYSNNNKIRLFAVTVDAIRENCSARSVGNTAKCRSFRGGGPPPPLPNALDRR